MPTPWRLQYWKYFGEGEDLKMFKRKHESKMPLVKWGLKPKKIIHGWDRIFLEK